MLMLPQVPAIYSPRIERTAVTFWGRILALAISAGCLQMLIIGARLNPDPAGMGTHTQLGLPACSFAAATGLPCPTCGMTTSVSWLARGNLAASFYVQPMGAVIGLIAIAAFWLGIYVAITGRAAYRLILFIPSRYYVFSLLSFWIIAWAWKIFIHLRGFDGWHA
jgi:uncharacterized protein DUF2752